MSLDEGYTTEYVDNVLRVWHCVNQMRVRPDMYIEPFSTTRDISMLMRGISLCLQFIHSESAQHRSYWSLELQDDASHNRRSSHQTSPIEAGEEECDSDSHRSILERKCNTFDEWVCSLLGIESARRIQQRLHNSGEVILHELSLNAQTMLIDVFEGSGADCGAIWMVALELSKPLNSSRTIHQKVADWSTQNCRNLRSR